jgi:glutathione S-transferase
MQLYFRPFACSLASRIALIESGHDAEFHHVDGHMLSDGNDFHSVNSLGYVPALHIGEPEALTENTAVLQYIADSAPESNLLAPVGTPERYRTLQWLGFVATELHSKTFAALFDKGLSDEAKAHVREKAASRFERLSQHLADRDFLVGGHFTIADAYLLTVLNWCEYVGIDIKAWPVLDAYRTGLRGRPSVAKAIGEERPLLKVA